uniref:Kazrin n=1 Tax=Aotus nancymaae TaxID=37293 RepID=A0A2K5DHD9_AOTNA
MMEDNKQLALRIDGAVQSASQEVTNLRAELTLAELSGGGAAASASAAAADSAATNMENPQLGAQGRIAPAPRAEEGERARRAPEVAGDSGSPTPGGGIALHCGR